MRPMPLELDREAADFETGFARFIAAKREVLDDVDRVVREIVEDVRRRGDAALVDYGQRFDRVTLSADRLRIDDGEIAAAERACAASELEALGLAAERIAAFHRQQMPGDLDYRDSLGARLGQRWTALRSVGLYVPGGRAAYPSSVLMNGVPAKAAGVDRLVMVVPTPDGEISPLVLAAARLAGVDEVYRVGGAQAIAALAFGTDRIRAVDKIVGPGNAYVAAAKKQVFGLVGIDTIAGPSEILVVADGANDPRWIAADLLAQAEHDPAAQSVLITDDKGFATAVSAAVEDLLARLPRADIARESWRRQGAVITVPSLEAVVPLIDEIAPEHLELAVEDPDALAKQVRNAGAIFLGRHTPEAIGDYVAGPNHVLPTSRSARFASGLSLLDFMKRTSLVELGPEQLRRLGPAAAILAESEGLTAHALSVTVRLDALNRAREDRASDWDSEPDGR